MGLELVAEHDLDTLLHSIVRRAVELLDGSGGGLYLYQPHRDALEWTVTVGPNLAPIGTSLRLGEGLAGKVWETGEPVIVDDYRRWKHRATFLGDRPYAAIVGVPVRWRSDFLGVLEIMAPAPRTFSPADAELLSLFATQAGVAIENTQLHAETQRRLKEQVALREASAVISSALDRETVLNRIAEQMGQAIDATSAYICSYHPQARESTVLAEYFGPQACEQERISDLGLTYPEIEHEFIETIQAGQHNVSHVDDPNLLESERAHMQQYGAQTILYIPLRIKERLIGFAELWESRRRREFTPEEIALCQSIAQQAAIALENARLFEETRRRAAQATLVYEVGQRVSSKLELTPLLSEIVTAVRDAFDYHNVMLMLVDEEEERLTLQSIAGAYADVFPPDLQVHIGEGMIGYAAASGEIQISTDVSQDPHFVRKAGETTQSELTVPIKSGQKVIGVLDLQSDKLGAFDDTDVMVVETLADQIAVAIENARLYEAVQSELTERKRAEEKLQQYAAQLEQINEEVKQFAYIVSHDLRAPLTNLKGFAAELDFALNEIQSTVGKLLVHLDEEQRHKVTTLLEEDIPEALNFIASSATRMDRFISAVLKLSRLGRRELNPEPIDVNELVQTVLQTLAHQIEERQVKVTCGDLPPVVADRTSMEQIMGNILANAVNYLVPGRPGEIEITAEQDVETTTFHIRDNGRGIAEEDMDKIFAPFRRAGKQDIPGEGMGLPYVQTLVRRHGGRIWCESEPGVGTTFSFTLSNYPGPDHHPAR